MLSRLPLFVRCVVLTCAVFILSFSSSGQIRDGGIDPWNLGKGDWIYSVKDATNRLGGHISSVTNEVSMMQYYKSIGVRYLIIKMGTGSTNYSGCYATPHQVTPRLCQIAKTNGVWIFGYTRSYGSDVAGESALADSCFNNGADGFVFDAEAEWEQNQPWIGSNGPALAWQLCSMVRSNWPNKFLGHAPFPILSFHSSFPYKEFGYWCDAVMPQIYHFSQANWPGLKGSPSAAINWFDVNFRSWQNSLIGQSSVINGQTIYWTNSIKPITPLQDVYGDPGNAANRCNGTTSAHPDEDVMEFIDYSAADPDPVTVGGYRGINFWRSDLHSAGQFANIKAGTSGDFSNVVNNIVIDDARAVNVGGWAHVRVFAATTTLPSYYGETGTDTNSFGTNYFRKAQGNGDSYMEYRPTISTAGYYRVYEWHPYRVDAATDVPFVISHGTGTTTVLANQQTNSGNWSSLGQFFFNTGTNATIRIYDNFSDPAAVALVDGLKLVYVQPVSTPARPTGLAATAVSSSQIDLIWNDVATNETAYIVSQSTTSGGPYSDIATLPPDSINFSSTGLSPSTAYFFVVRATNTLGASINSLQATATTSTATPTVPTITTQPQSQSVNVSSNAAFSVVASGSGQLSFQWRFNNTNISGATQSSYTRFNVQPGDAGNYSVVVTNNAGSITSSNALLSVVVVPPSILQQPQNTEAASGMTKTLNVKATGSPALLYQWRFNGTNLPGATLSALTLTNITLENGGSYSVTVSNLGGGVVSSSATLTVHPTFTPSGWTAAWRLGGGSRSYLSSSGHVERGMAFNPNRNHLLIIGRSPSTQIFVLDADSGDELYTMNVDGSVVSGSSPGGFPLLMIGAADDGAVYAANLTTAPSTSPFRIYRWANDSSNTVPTIAFSGDPAPGNTQRWGDTIDVRGSGTDTQIIVGSRSGNVVALFTTANGLSFTPKIITVSDSANGNFGLGLSFGANTTFWSKAVTLPLRLISYDFNAGTGFSLRSHTNDFPSTVSPIGANPALNLLAGISIESNDKLKLYNVANTPPSLIAETNFATANSNTFYVGSVDFGPDRVFALDPNNGIVAMQLLSSPTSPTFTTQPTNRTANTGENVTFVASATGSTPLSYQWLFNGTNIVGATSSVLTRNNVQTNDAGVYSVIASNVGGTLQSTTASLTVNPPSSAKFESVNVLPNGHLQLTFSGQPGTPYWIDKSTNLFNWVPFTNVVSPSGIIQFTDETVTDSAHTFYRARQ